MKLGIIGGLGPLASSYFYELLTKMSDVHHDQEHLEIYLHSCPRIPDRTEYILDHRKPSPILELIQVAKKLEAAGVDMIAIPCITAHYFHEELSQAVDIPIIHLIQEVRNYILRKQVKKVGIMATDGTIQSQIFQKELKEYNIDCCIPSIEYQKDVMHIIYDNVKCGKAIEMNCFYGIEKDLLLKGADLIILGCTELSIVNKEEKLDSLYLDAMELLSAVALQKCQIPIKKEYQYLIK